MKNALITILGIIVIGLGGYVGYQHLNPSTNFDKDIQVAPTQSSSGDSVSRVSREESSEITEDNGQVTSDMSSSDSETNNNDGDVSKESNSDPDTDGLPSTHTYHLTDNNGDEVYCSYDSSKQQFIENVRDDVQPRIFSKDGQQIQ